MDEKEIAEDLATMIAGVVKEWVPAPWGAASALLISRYGKRPIAYFLPGKSKEEPSTADQLEQPNFAVVGMGRCGVHVAVALHLMVYKEATAAARDGSISTRRTNVLKNWIRELVNPSSGKKALSFKPVMLVGDTDDTTFADVKGLTAPRQVGSAPTSEDASVLVLSYDPLATAGVGNNPILAQFFTRALLLCPDSKIGGQTFDWSAARQFLLAVESDGRKRDRFPEEKTPPRLAFYVFSAAGGTGCGAAAEILRAQQFALAAANQSALTYYCGVAVLPDPKSEHEDALRSQRKRMLNVGRFVVQYLADQSIILPDESAYTEVPTYRGGSIIAHVAPEEQSNDTHSEPKPIVEVNSWNSVLFVSNSIMRPADEPLERAVELANQYIAQQLFNLAGPQISARNLTISDPNKLPQKNFETIRLDAMDLLTSLRGPCACCFAAATTKEVKRDDNDSLAWLRNMFLRAISLPSRREGASLIEGISMSPCEPTDFLEKLGTGSFEDKIARCAELPFFKQCGSLVFTLTAPQDGTIMNDELAALLSLCADLFPNLKETRYSAIYGTTELYTLSLYVEGSIVFAPEIQKAVKNYLYLCWPLARKMEKDKFEEWWNSMLNMKPPILAANVAGTIGETEYLQAEYSGLPQAKQVALRSWASVVAQVASEEARAALLSRVKFEDFEVGAKEIVAALSFYNYFTNRRWLETL